MILKNLLSTLCKNEKIAIIVQDTSYRNEVSKIIFYDYVKELNQVLFIRDYIKYKVKFLETGFNEETEEVFLTVGIDTKKISLSKRITDGIRKYLISNVGVIDAYARGIKNIHALALYLSHFYEIEFINDRQIELKASYDDIKDINSIINNYLRNEKEYINKLDCIDDETELEASYKYLFCNEMKCKKIYNDYKRIQALNDNFED